MTTSVAIGRPRSTSGSGKWLRGTAVAIVLLAAFNGALYVAAPELYSVDLAKGPYTEANNLELTRVYNRAIPLYEQIVASFPDSEYAVLSRIGIAKSNLGLGRSQDALDQYGTLLVDVADSPEFATYRYTILASMASIYRDMSDADGHARIFAQLEADYPDSDAVKQERTYLATLVPATDAAAAPELPADFPLSIDRDGIVLPEAVAVGDTFELRIRVAPANGATGPFSLMTNLGLWQGLAVERITPTPTSVAEFWGRRQWQFASTDAPLEIVATLKATKPGTYEFDLDVESNYNIAEIGVTRTITVEE